MSVIGQPADWADLIDSMVPDILKLVVEAWAQLPPPSSGVREDNITEALCRILRQNRTVRALMFQIQTQFVELDPMPGEEQGRLDIAFIPTIPREDYYFCIECKRLNVTKDGKLRAYAYEYVRFGMMRFVTGQYSKTVRHGGMIGYVLDGRVAQARKNVATNIRKQHVALCMKPPGLLLPSTVLKGDDRARETQHHRPHETTVFSIHHLFMAG